MTLAPERSITEAFNWDTAYRGINTPKGVYQFAGFLLQNQTAIGVFGSAIKHNNYQRAFEYTTY
jgi:hypothetical protein